MSSRFKTVALIGKYKNPDIIVPLPSLARYLQERNVEVVLDRLTASNVAENEWPVLDMEEIGSRVNLAVVLGGDGTMLNIARKLAPFGVPWSASIRDASGFSTDLSIDTMVETGSMLEGQYIEERRMLLYVEVFRDNNVIFDALALNDVAVSRGIGGNMIEFEVRINGE